MITPQDMSDEAFLAAFLDCSMPPAGFDHLGHLRIAWILLRRHPLPRAVEECCDGIRRLAGHLGVPGKYNRTLSEALVRLMAAGGADHLDWPDFLAANPPMITDARGLLDRYYSPERLNSEAARLSFLPPDRSELPR